MTTAHLVVHTHNQWGHDKPLVAFFGRLAERRSASALIITFLVSTPALPQLRRELESAPGKLHERVNLIDVGLRGKGLVIPGFAPFFQDLWDVRPIVCGTSKREYRLPRPTFAIIDIFRPYDLPAVKRISDGACPVVTWVPFPMTSFLRYAGPQELGGLEDLAALADYASAATGESVADASERLLRETHGQIVKTPGLPDLFDYEFFPQVRVFPEGYIVKNSPAQVRASDGVLNVTSPVLERQAIDVVRGWLVGAKKSLWVIGPLEESPPTTISPTLAGEVNQNADEDERILRFLDKMVNTHGKDSVVLISFGTIFYPKDMEKLSAFFDELLNAGTPFLWAHASKIMTPPAELLAKIDASPNATHSNWIPQRAVLHHPGTGWFVSHGGWNSVQEALAFRVPLVMWPFSADQPANAALLSITHDAAFELLSVRAGDGARQPLRMRGKGTVDFSVDGMRKEVRALLDKLKGPEGTRVRANTLRLGEELDKSWHEGGQANEDAERFLHRFVGPA